MYAYLITRCNGGVKDFLGSWSMSAKGLLVLAAAAYTEVTSGLLHLTADNPAFNDVPFFGSLARGFQSHHDDPSGIARLEWLDFLTKIDAGMILLLAWGTFIHVKSANCAPVNNECKGTKRLVAFCWMTVPM